MAVIAIDLGGTKVASAIFPENARPVAHRVASLDGRTGREVGLLIVGEIVRLMEEAATHRIPLAAIGISVPGISRERTGRVWAPNIPGWEDFPLRRMVQQAMRSWALRRGLAHRTPIPVFIDNDRACYILGETWRGAAKGCRNAIFLAVGTGIGAGILADGRVLRGAHDIAGAIGWLALNRPFRPEYVPCGCFEHHASGEGLAKVARELLAVPPAQRAGLGWAAKTSPTSGAGALSGADSPAAPEIFAAYQRGDAVARAVVGQAIEFWGMAVANLVSLFNPERILFGGGVFGPAVKWLDAIHTEARKWAQPIAINQVELVAAKLGADAGLYGAAWSALKRMEVRQARHAGGTSGLESGTSIG